MSLSTHIQAQIAAAQVEAEQTFHEDRTKIDLDTRKSVVPGGFGIELRGSGNVITATPIDKRIVGGPKVGEVKQTGSPVHAAPGTQSWGKPTPRS